MNIRELALLARLSAAATSLALRGSPKVSAKTRTRVQALARKAGYQVDARISSVMSHFRKPETARLTACFGLITFYPEERPWEKSIHMRQIYAGMERRAGELGYRVEPLWLRAPGMTHRRFREILEARGIEGLLCFGSPKFDEAFPSAFERCTAVNIGLSISTPLHRIISHAFNDTLTALNELYRRGYRRPGLVLSRYEEIRNGYAHASAYLGWCEHRSGEITARPILRMDRVDTGTLQAWLKSEGCDGVIFVHPQAELAQLQISLKRLRAAIPEELGVAVLSQNLEGTRFSGLQENQAVMGAWAVELLAARIASRDFGLPAMPRVELVESQWIKGETLRPVLVNS
ncbi:LacI family transcriptional regulator [Nibricoccus aquaticus]|uniref:LacI family transcriptional regulator n=1 Tax=Nibricoccus aquaticus TaxID=2576891 RepID=A0A290QMV6_9BACT|nr:LacI family DNA-binding transcriptional regulator [Nibricoccus aquaticus]ATC65542.1 LacI family transcriptional regulator [Nibricoccus aquaticus]